MNIDVSRDFTDILLQSFLNHPEESCDNWDDFCFLLRDIQGLYTLTAFLAL